MTFWKFIIIRKFKNLHEYFFLNLSMSIMDYIFQWVNLKTEINRRYFSSLLWRKKSVQKSINFIEVNSTWCRSEIITCFFFMIKRNEIIHLYLFQLKINKIYKSKKCMKKWNFKCVSISVRNLDCNIYIYNRVFLYLG